MVPETPQADPAGALRRRTQKLTAAVALVLGLPLVSLAYRLGVPGIKALFSDKPIRAFMMVPREGPARELAMPGKAAALNPGAAPQDSTQMIAHEPEPAQPPAAAQTAVTAPPAPLPPKTPPALAEPAQHPPADPPPFAQPPQNEGAAQPNWPHLRVKSFKQQEAERQPTMFLMNVGPQDPNAKPIAYPTGAKGGYSYNAQQPAAETSGSQTHAPPQAAAPAAPPAAPPSAQTPPKKKITPIPHNPPPRTNVQPPGTKATTSGIPDPERFTVPAPEAPATISGPATLPIEGGGVTVGPPDKAPSPNPQTTGAGPAPPKPIPLNPPPRTDNRQPGQAPNQP